MQTKTQDTESLRKERTEKALKRCAQIDKSIQRRQKEIDEKEDFLGHFRGDIAFWTQPGSFPLRRKAIRYQDKIFQLRKEIRKLELKKKNIMTYKTAVKGDMERALQQERKANDQIITKGTRIKCALYGPGTVIKVNKKTYTYTTDNGYTVNIDKSWAQVIE